MNIINVINQIKQDIFDLESELQSHLNNCNVDINNGRLKETREFNLTTSSLQSQIREKKEDILELVLNCEINS